MDVLDPLFPTLVRTARTLMGWSQARLAKEAGVSVPFISRLERGERLGHAGKLRQLRDALTQAGVVFEIGPETVGVRLQGDAAKQLNSGHHG